MLNVRQVSDILDVSPVRVKQILKENPNFVINRENSNNGIIKIPHSTVRNLLENKGLFYKKRIVTIGMEKGGVGKSLLTINTAINLSSRGARVLIIDLDPEACATNHLAKKDLDFNSFKTIYEVFKHGLQIKEIVVETRYPCRGKARRADRLVSDRNPKKLLKDQMKGLVDYDLILFDVPPTFSKLISSAYLTSELVIIPTFPDIWSLESVQLTIDDIKEDSDNFEAIMPEIKILMNKFNPARKASQDAWDTLIEDYKTLVLPFQITESTHFQNSINEGFGVIETRANRNIKEQIDFLSQYICPLEADKKIRFN
jgi:chromosome partitioning protein